MGEKTLYVYLFRLFPRGFLGYFNTITFAFPSLKTIFSLYIFIVHIRTFYTCICYSLSLSSTALPPHFPLSSLSTWCGVGRRKEPMTLTVFFLTVHTHHVSGKYQKPHFQNCISSLWLLKKTSVVPMWDRKSGLHWHRPCGCFGTGAHTPVGYRCLLFTINVASMWNHGTAILHRGPRLW